MTRANAGPGSWLQGLHPQAQVAGGIPGSWGRRISPGPPSAVGAPPETPETGRFLPQAGQLQTCRRPVKCPQVQGRRPQAGQGQGGRAGARGPQWWTWGTRMTPGSSGSSAQGQAEDRPSREPPRTSCPAAEPRPAQQGVSGSRGRPVPCPESGAYRWLGSGSPPPSKSVCPRRVCVLETVIGQRPPHLPPHLKHPTSKSQRLHIQPTWKFPFTSEAQNHHQLVGTQEAPRSTETGRQSEGWPGKRSCWEDNEGNSVGGSGKGPCKGSEQEITAAPPSLEGRAGLWEDSTWPSTQQFQPGVGGGGRGGGQGSARTAFSSTALGVVHVADSSLANVLLKPRLAVLVWVCVFLF